VHVHVESAVHVLAEIAYRVYGLDVDAGSVHARIHRPKILHVYNGPAAEMSLGFAGSLPN
jgi:hypothetical protein